MKKETIGTLGKNKIVKITQEITSQKLVTKYVDNQPYKKLVTIKEEVEYYSIENEGSWISQFETKE